MLVRQIIITMVSPPSILLLSLWECAQKSVTAVTPEKALPFLSFWPILHSWARSSVAVMLSKASGTVERKSGDSMEDMWSKWADRSFSWRKK